MPSSATEIVTSRWPACHGIGRNAIQMVPRSVFAKPTAATPVTTASAAATPSCAGRIRMPSAAFCSRLVSAWPISRRSHGTTGP